MGAEDRHGGSIAAHDYLDLRTKKDVFGVTSPVDEFFGARAVNVVYAPGFRMSPSWLVEIPTSSANAAGSGSASTARHGSQARSSSTL